MKYYGKIFFTMDENHPDIKCVKDWTEDKVYDFDDVYTFNEDYDEEEVVAYIKKDLSFVAGGGYNADNIHDVTFEIKRV